MNRGISPHDRPTWDWGDRDYHRKSAQHWSIEDSINEGGVTRKALDRVKPSPPKSKVKPPKSHTHDWDYVYRWEPYRHRFWMDELPNEVGKYRYRTCKTCGCDDKLGWKPIKIRDIQDHELEACRQENEKWKQQNRWWMHYRYGIKEDHTPVTRDEHKQAPKKRVERKRPHEE